MRRRLTRRTFLGWGLALPATAAVAPIDSPLATLAGEVSAVAIPFDMPGYVVNLWFQAIVMDGVGAAVHMTLRYAGDSSDRDRLPAFWNIHISNISCKNARAAIEMFGLPDAGAISGVTMQDVQVRSRTGLRAEHVQDMCLTRFKLETDQSPAMRLLDCRDVTIEQSCCAEGTEGFLQVDGADSRAIRLRGGNQTGASRDVKLGKDVSPDAVTAEPEVQSSVEHK